TLPTRAGTKIRARTSIIPEPCQTGPRGLPVRYKTPPARGHLTGGPAGRRVIDRGPDRAGRSPTARLPGRSCCFALSDRPFPTCEPGGLTVFLRVEEPACPPSGSLPPPRPVHEASPPHRPLGPPLPGRRARGPRPDAVAFVRRARLRAAE